MFMIANAWKNVIRNKGRNLLVMVIVAIIAAAAAIGLSIRQAAQSARATGLANTTVTAQISLDRSKLMAAAQKQSANGTQPDFQALRQSLAGKELSLTDYQKYAKTSTAVKSTYYSQSAGLSATTGFQPVSTSSSSTSGSTSDSTTSGQSGSQGSSGSSQSSQGYGADGPMGGRGMDSGDFKLTGFSSDAAVANAANGKFTMSSGKVFGYDKTANGQIIISKALAQFNNLKVGDTVTAANTTDSTKTYKLTIVGIYANTGSTSSAPGGMGNASDPDNAIYTSFSTLDSLGLSGSSTNGGSQLDFTYVVASKAAYETFAKEVKAAGLSSDYTVSSPDITQYEASLVPLDNLAKFALTLLLIVLGVGGAVLIALNVFNIRERKYEVGVLTAIGIRKAKVAAQFVFELLIVTMIGLAIGAAAGSIASVPVSNHLLAGQVAAQQSQQASQAAQFGRGMQGGSMQSGSQSQGAPAPAMGGGFAAGRASALGKTTSYISSINSTVSISVVGELVLIGLALTVVSSLAAVVVIMRYEPLQILADRS
jgi:putative ABC transport system permease protein